ncbi:hypothetical protein J3Q64DRAFT_1848098 [Phycomyces blakesleeanus]|uniref:Uncharacterized protein n=2 Tax=Phycomyces blakesleeanus TaxID=4837 RepID=A0A162NBN2_PHYB8|nr:hypothetical protein PHYBLDRAFT_183479 [Phycomyces blakesleeanus NRRL 1555(-)]OAD67694.1 hypothetical protein PHYBLDRAFT_183479 [Phycomyces blakesleeanus NRRL 1555(-)]|eukprot:XP_018285734.1 hypothetical protein PHYBLDRAFT_183479 [Phycomyces blakesleeanus NRRL 1555(-)]
MKFSAVLVIVTFFSAVAFAAPRRSSQDAIGIGNEGRVSGLGNNLFKGGFASDNSQKNTVNQRN